MSNRRARAREAKRTYQEMCEVASMLSVFIKPYQSYVFGAKKKSTER